MRPFYLWALFLSGTAWAGEDEELVVVGHALEDEDSRDSTGFSEHLRAEDQARAVSDMGDLLRGAVGAEVRESGNQAQTLSLRGAGANQVAVFMDEIPISNSRGGAVDLSLLPLSFFEQAEVLRGASGAAYGSGAQGGVVHLRTKSARQGWLSNGRLRLGSGQFAGAEGELQEAGESHHLLLSLQCSRAEGDFAFQDENEAIRKRLNNHHAQGGGLARWRLDGAGGRRLSFLASAQGGTRGEPGMEQFENLKASSDRVQSLWAVSAADPTFFEGRLQGSAVLAFRELRYRFDDPEPLLVGSTQNFYLKDRDLSASTHWDWTGFKGHRERILGQIRFEQAETERDDAADREESRKSAALVLSERWETKILRLEASLRADFSSDRDPVFVPKLGAVVPLGAQVTLRSGIGRAFRDPSFDELYFEGPGIRGNPQLRPEEGYGLDLGFQWHPNRFFDAELVVFKEDYDRMILFSRDNPYLLKARDDFQAVVQGAESKIRFHSKWLEFGEAVSFWDARFGHAPHYRLPYRPRWHSFSEAAVFLCSARIYASYEWKGDVTTDSLGQRHLPAYGRLDLGMEGAWKSGWKTGLSLKNALGSNGYDAVQSPLPKQALMWTLSFEQRGRAESEGDGREDAESF